MKKITAEKIVLYALPLAIAAYLGYRYFMSKKKVSAPVGAIAAVDETMVDHDAINAMGDQAPTAIAPTPVKATAPIAAPPPTTTAPIAATTPTNSSQGASSGLLRVEPPTNDVRVTQVDYLGDVRGLDISPVTYNTF